MKKKINPKLKINTKKKSYPLDQSPFYFLRSKKKLAELFGVVLHDLLIISKDTSTYYHEFSTTKNGKSRMVQEPIRKLKFIHNKIASFLCRIEVPDYLHSGVKHRSNITNAAAHANDKKLLTADIKSYFESTKRDKVFNFYRSHLKCSADIAEILTNLSCVKGHIPTGSQISMPLAYWANMGMFNDFMNLSLKHGVIMTVYVDDITFSGQQINKLFLSTLRKIAVRHSHNLHPNKSKIYSKESVKVVTGVAINNDSLLITNAQHAKLYEGFSLIKSLKGVPFSSDSSTAQSLLGRLYALSSIDPKMKERAKTLKSSLLN